MVFSLKRALLGLYVYLLVVPFLIRDTRESTILLHELFFLLPAFMWFVMDLRIKAILSNGRPLIDEKTDREMAQYVASHPQQITPKPANSNVGLLISPLYIVLTILLACANIDEIPSAQPIERVLVSFFIPYVPLLSKYESTVGTASHWYNIAMDSSIALKAEFAHIVTLLLSATIILLFLVLVTTRPLHQRVTLPKPKNTKQKMAQLFLPFFIAILLADAFWGLLPIDPMPHLKTRCFQNFYCWSHDGLMIFDRSLISFFLLTLFVGVLVVLPIQMFRKVQT